MSPPPARHRRPLFSRLTSGQPPKSLTQDIIENLSGVLNSRKGYGSVVPELGLGEFFSRRNSRGATEILQQELERNIVVLEPRLEQPKVQLIGEDHEFWLHFSVDGAVDGEHLRLLISFQTTLGAVRVREA